MMESASSGTEQQPQGFNEQNLPAAFAEFNRVSEQLSHSYRFLENKVESLTQELDEVSAQRLAELKAKEQLATRLENLLHMLPGGVVVLDANGVVSENNPAAEALLEESLKGRQWREVISSCFAPQKDDGHEVSTRSGRLVNLATRSLESGIGQLILITDQTETRRLQAEVSRNERLSALGKMVSALAHQIRTPLSTALLYAGHLSNKQLDDGQRQRFANKMVSRLNHMEQQVQDMLLFVKGEIPQEDLMTVGELAEDLEEAMEVPVNAHSAVYHLENQCPEIKIKGNRESLVSAVLNLVNNSLEASDKYPPELWIYFKEHNGQLLIEVVDNGPGIDPKVSSCAAELFVTTKSQGTGIGLAVVTAVAKAHGGEFNLQSNQSTGSNVGEGATATLTIPQLVENDNETPNYSLAS
ncbi:MAG: PAS domain-containing sensor histidine kinase [Cellvibrionaceae bacterium]